MAVVLLVVDVHPPAGRSGANRYPEACLYCSGPLRDIVQCGRLFPRMLNARGLIQQDDKQKSMMAAEDGGYETADDEGDNVPPAPARRI